MNKIRFEEVCTKILRSPQWEKKLLIGSLLSFIPILNLFSCGYIYRYSLQIRRSGDFLLPNWQDWGALFIDGLRFFIVALVYMGIPLIIGYILSILLIVMSLGLLFPLGYFPFALTILTSPTLFAAALYHLQENEQWSSLLNIKTICSYVLRSWRYWIIPGIALSGLLVIGSPIYGVVFFLGFLMILPYTTVLFYFLDHN